MMPLLRPSKRETGKTSKIRQLSAVTVDVVQRKFCGTNFWCCCLDCFCLCFCLFVHLFILSVFSSCFCLFGCFCFIFLFYCREGQRLVFWLDLSRQRAPPWQMWQTSSSAANNRMPEDVGEDDGVGGCSWRMRVRKDDGEKGCNFRR